MSKWWSFIICHLQDINHPVDHDKDIEWPLQARTFSVYYTTYRHVTETLVTVDNFTYVSIRSLFSVWPKLMYCTVSHMKDWFRPEIDVHVLQSLITSSYFSVKTFWVFVCVSLYVSIPPLLSVCHVTFLLWTMLIYLT